MVYLCTALFHKLNANEFNRIIRWSKLTKTNPKLRTKFSFKIVLFEALWSIPEAIENGFDTYMNKHMKEYKQLCGYHDHNCKTECIVCIDRDIIKEHLRCFYERKES